MSTAALLDLPLEHELAADAREPLDVEPRLDALERDRPVFDPGDTVSVDLLMSENELWAQARHMHRQAWEHSIPIERWS